MTLPAHHIMSICSQSKKTCVLSTYQTVFIHSQYKANKVFVVYKSLCRIITIHADEHGWHSPFRVVVSVGVLVGEGPGVVVQVEVGL